MRGMKIGGLILLLALPACCILLTVVTAGTLAAIGGWFVDGPGLALVAAVGVGLTVYILWRWRGRSDSSKVREPRRGQSSE